MWLWGWARARARARARAKAKAGAHQIFMAIASLTFFIFFLVHRISGVRVRSLTFFIFFLVHQSGVGLGLGLRLGLIKYSRLLLTYVHSLRQRADDPDSAYCYTTGCGIRPVPNRNHNITSRLA